MTTSEPLVSVIVPCYNHANFVKICMQSILKQSYQNFELIILDDGSSDNSKAVVESFLESLPASQQRIKIFLMLYI